MLDACRDDPFLKEMQRSIATTGSLAGTPAIEPEGATLIVFPAKEADRGGRRRQSQPVSASLLERLQEPSRNQQAFRLVTSDVLRATANQQRPFVYGSLPGEEDYYFKTR